VDSKPSQDKMAMKLFTWEGKNITYVGYDRYSQICPSCAHLRMGWPWFEWNDLAKI
jgi:hypothetical protein